MDEAQYVAVPVSILVVHDVLLTWEKESEGWNVEERDLFGDAGTVQEANEARRHIRDYRRCCGGG